MNIQFEFMKIFAFNELKRPEEGKKKLFTFQLEQKYAHLIENWTETRLSSSQG